MKKLLASLLVVSFLAVPTHLDSPPESTPVYLMAHIKKETIRVIDTKQQEIMCLAKNIFYEASNEPKDGKLAVGLVTMNRTKNKNFPKTVCGVVHQRNSKACQFSWVCGHSLGFNSKQFNESLSIAKQVYSQYGKITDITHGALYFHSVRMYPSWASPERYTTTIGNHNFYRF